MGEVSKKGFLLGGIILCVLLLVAVFTPAIAKVQKTSAVPPTSPYDRSDKECFGCHEMNPEIATWKISSHSKIPCTACHSVNPEDYKTKIGTDKRPIKITNAIPNSVCEQCHTQNRETTPSGDLIIPHQKHSAAGVTCVKCHAGVVHAKISERGITAEGNLSDYKAWNDSTAKQVATSFFTQPDMWTCINCHKSANVTRKCSACHSVIPELPSHNSSAWKSEHGKVARTNIGECTKCHVTPGRDMFITPSTGDKAVDFARAQQFCYNCHNQRPESHTKTWKNIHPQNVSAKGVQNCFTCHDANQPTAKSVTGTYCNQCHWFTTNTPVKIDPPKTK
ncbi:MAG: cytochrome c3 family protein [Thermincola sp.]|jgi:nitrate/TMAO reductase-like tetraheme cytochrome c subunit|nr:cytochrome c3 family protein [Thermincola sp.]MDT3703833.1 cytochrome c3 family protein [Thermincola sp.]